METCIKELFKKLKLEKIEKIENIDSSQNNVYKITTATKIYILKKYSKFAIKNKKELNIRNTQINISAEFNRLGIKTILPLKFEKEYFIYYKKNYYLIYNFYDYKVILANELTLQNIKILADTQAEIHKLNLKNNIRCHYKPININLSKYIKKYSNFSNIQKILNNNLIELKELIKNCNNNLNIMKENLCVSHNDYKLKNILWNQEEIYLIDFDACGLSNPTVSLIESAFSLSLIDNKINLEYYKEYLKEYIKTYGIIKDNYEEAIMVAMNGKLQWLEYLFKIKKDPAEIYGMLNELVLFINYKKEFLDIYLSL